MIPTRTLHQGSLIPHRLIRCIPQDVAPECEAWWSRFADLHPGWDMVTIVDPIDPMDWPLMGHLHRLTTSGAQLAGMVRLEAVYRWGGWYVDADVEPVRCFGPLGNTDRVVIGTEDGVHLTDAVFGAPVRHRAIRDVMEHVGTLYADTLSELEGRLPGAQATGPLATTAVLTGRPDVQVLPTETFYPYSYTERHRAGEDHAARPGVYAIHRWHFSWEGT